MEMNNTDKPTSDMEAQLSKTRKHKPLLAFMIICTAVLFLFTMLMTYFDLSDTGIELGIFSDSNETFLRGPYENEISLPSWTFVVMWGTIYTWQIVWLVYAITGLFRKTANGSPVYVTPEIHTPVLFGVYMFNLASGIAWTLMYDRQLITWSLIPILMLPFTLYICLVISHRRLMENGSYMMKTGMRKEIWMIRMFVQNGLAFYAAWVSIAPIFQFTTVLIYSLGVDLSIASSVALAIVTFEVELWFVLDIFVFERYTRYQFTPYIVVIVALAGVLVPNYTPMATNSIFTLVLISVAIFNAIVKVVMLFYRHFTRPVFSDDESNEIENTKL